MRSSCQASGAKHMESVVQALSGPAFAGKHGLRMTACVASVALGFLPLPMFAQSSPPPTPVTQVEQGGQTSPSAEARLEALRHTLIDRALKGPTRIRTAAWVDETGTLRENLQINSDVTLRGIRVLSYLDQTSPEQSRLLVDAETSARRIGALECTTSAPGGRFKRHAALIGHFTPGEGRLGYHFLPELALEAQAMLLKLFAFDEAWVLTPSAPDRSAYEQALFGRDRDMPRGSPYALRLGLVAGEATQLPAIDQAVRDLWRSVGFEKQTLAALPVRVLLQLEERSSGRILWRNEVLIDYPEIPVSMTRATLPAELTGALEQSLRNAHKALQQALACEPLRFATSVSDTEQITIAAGTRVGLRAGDQLLLVDRTRFPGHMLEKGSLDKAALIEIESVSQDQSLARRVAGPPPVMHQGNLVAMPL